MGHQNRKPLNSELFAGASATSEFRTLRPRPANGRMHEQIAYLSDALIRNLPTSCSPPREPIAFNTTPGEIDMKIRRTIAAVIAAGALAATGTVTNAHAQPMSPFVPNPPFWCPGNGPGLSASGYGGYCEGKTFPDGTRLNVYRVGYFWQPIRCIIPDGSMMPPLAPPGGCGGALG